MKETAYLLQAALISIWWIGLFSSKSFFDAFQFGGISPTAFWAFLVPDMTLIAGLSIIRAYWNSEKIDYVILGAFGYASLYCFNATLLTASGYLPTGLMLLGLAYNIFLCFNRSMFRQATSGFTQNVFKTLIQIVCIWLISLAVIPIVILDAFDTFALPTVDVRLYLGVGFFACCSVLGLSSAYFMVRDGAGTPLPLDQPNNLVMSGPYRFVRNPMAIAGIGQGLAIALVFHSFPLVVYSLLGAIVWHTVVRPIEERDMADRFGAAYQQYRQQVSCWIPTLNRKSTR